MRFRAAPPRPARRAVGHFVALGAADELPAERLHPQPEAARADLEAGGGRVDVAAELGEADAISPGDSWLALRTRRLRAISASR